MSGARVHARQQRPAPAGGLIFKREWFKFYDEPPRVGTWLQSWDMTFKDSPSGDYVVGLQAVRQGADIVLIDRVKGQWTFSETCQQLLALQRRHPHTQTILIEDAANGPAIINALGRQVLGIIGVTPEGGKVARAQAAQAGIGMGATAALAPRRLFALTGLDFPSARATANVWTSVWEADVLGFRSVNSLAVRLRCRSPACGRALRMGAAGR